MNERQFSRHLNINMSPFLALLATALLVHREESRCCQDVHRKPPIREVTNDVRWSKHIGDENAKSRVYWRVIHKAYYDSRMSHFYNISRGMLRLGKEIDLQNITMHTTAWDATERDETIQI